MGLDVNFLNQVNLAFKEFLTNCKLYGLVKERYATTLVPPTATHIDGNQLDLIAGTKFILTILYILDH